MVKVCWGHCGKSCSRCIRSGGLSFISEQEGGAAVWAGKRCNHLQALWLKKQNELGKVHGDMHESVRVYEYMCKCMCVSVWMGASVYEWVWVGECVWVCKCMYECMWVSVYGWGWISMIECECVYKCVNVHAWLRMCVWTLNLWKPVKRRFQLIREVVVHAWTEAQQMGVVRRWQRWQIIALGNRADSETN